MSFFVTFLPLSRITNKSMNQITKLIHKFQSGDIDANAAVWEILKLFANSTTIATNREIEDIIAEKQKEIKELFNLSDDFWSGWVKGFRSCAEWYEKRNCKPF